MATFSQHLKVAVVEDDPRISQLIEDEVVDEGHRVDNFNTAEWPSFNVADAAIVVGILVFFVQQLMQDYLDKKAGKVTEDDLGDEELPDLSAEVD